VKERYLITYRLAGETRTAVSLTRDERKARETLAAAWKVPAAAVEIVSVQWFSPGAVKERGLGCV